MTGGALRAQLTAYWHMLDAVPPGTRIATCLPDAPQTAIALLALSHHAQLIAINPALTPPEMAALLHDAGAQMLVLPEGAPASDLDLPTAFLSQDGTLTVPRIDPSPAADPGLILMTSGSTGLPKRVPLSCAQLHRSAGRIARALHLSPEDCAVHALPMFHIGAIVDLLLAPLMAGGSAYFAGGMGAAPLRDAVLQGRATWMQLVPTMLNRLRADLSPEDAAAMGAQLRFIRSVSSDLAPDVQREAEALFGGTPIIQMYGMTETAGQITTNPLPPEARKPGSVGRAFEVDVRLGDGGELHVRGDAVTAGYEGLPKGDHFTPDGWLRTGDLARIDADGFVFLTGRAKEMINRGGEKISPHEIEHAALAFPGVTDAASFARAHASLGEEVGLAVTLAPGAERAALETHLAAHLAEFKRPRSVMVLDALPRLGSGKIDRRALQDMAHSEQTNTDAVHTGIAAKIAQAWRAVLLDASENGPAPETDFFDAGGDSLSGAQFVFEVERLTGRTLPPNLLYEAPVFADFVAATEMAPLRDGLSAAQAGDPKLAFLHDRLKRWQAEAVPGAGLFRKISGGDGTPLFWCVQEEGEYGLLAEALRADRPLFLMRSLFLMLGKNDAMNRDLARVYAQHMMQLVPTGPLLLGGFCEGAKIMRFAAEHLLAEGRDIRVLVSWDQWFDTPVDVPVLHLWTEDRFAKYTAAHVNPLRAIAPAHPAGFDVIRLPGGHTEVLTKGPLAPFLPRLKAALGEGLCMDTAQRGQFAVQTAGTLRMTAPRVLRKRQSAVLPARISNAGKQAWTEVTLIAQFRNLDGYTHPELAAAHSLTGDLAPGDVLDLSLDIKVPNAALPMWLMLDLVDGAGNRASAAGVKTPSRLVIAL